MPYKKTYRKKKPYRKKRYVRKPRASVIPRGLRQGIIPLSREKTTFMNTMHALPTDWAYGSQGGVAPGATTYNTLQHEQIFQMSELADIAEFQPLFRSYKLNCVIVTILNLHQNSMFTSGSPQNYYGGNVLVYTQLNRTGEPLSDGITQSYWDQTSAKKTFILRGQRSHRFKIYPKVLSNTFITSTTSTTTQRKPGWIATSDAGLLVPHFGLNMQFSLTDPSLPFNNSVSPPTEATAPLNFKITYKYLFQMRGIH